MAKKDQKQFQLDNKDACCIYLLRIITTTEKCLIKLKKYNTQSQKILDEYAKNGSTTVPYEIYGEFVDKTSNVIDYLLNILGDAQGISISYFKYRKQAKRLMNKNVEGVGIIEFTDDLNKLINEFNKMRNWQNHIPESLLTSERTLIEQGVYREHIRNPIEIYLYNTVTYELFKDLHENNVEFYNEARKLAQAAKRDYGCLIGERITIQRKYLNTPVNTDHLKATKMSAKIQGLKSE